MQLQHRLLLAATLLLGGWVTTAVAADPLNLPDLGSTKAAPAVVAQQRADNDAKCTRCHDENEAKPILSIYQTKHGVKGDPRTPSCQSCHGPSLNHLAGPGKDGKIAPPDRRFNNDGGFKVSSADDRAGACLTCHSGTQRTHWDGSPHQTNGLACNDCHKVHSPTDPVRAKKTQPQVCVTCHKERRADMQKFSHHPVAEGKVACSDCHNPHGSTAQHLMKKDTVNQTCWTCHADKRGPFLWEHQPATEDCTNCHNPHGSNMAPLLKSRPPFLCDECHDGPHNSQAPYGPGAAGIQSPNSGISTTSSVSGSYTTYSVKNPSSSAGGRACLNCHVMVHGSNNPAGAYLHR